MLEAEKQFRRINGHLHLPALRAALEGEIQADNAREECYNEDVAETGPPPEVLRDSGHPRSEGGASDATLVGQET
jgi:hypothetical protein